MKVNLCHYPGCEIITQNYYCEKHKLISEQRKKEHTKQLFKGTQRKESASYNNLYHTSQWRKLRKDFLIEFPYCVKCGNKANTVDHILDHKGNESLFWNKKNLQSMCSSCHSIKTLQTHSFSKKTVDR